MLQPIRRNTSSALTMTSFFFAAQALAGQVRPLYLVTVTPAQATSANSYGASVYTVDNQKRLQRIRKIMLPADGVSDIAEDVQGHLYFGSTQGISLIQEAHPERVDFITVKSFSTVPCWGAFAASEQESGVDFCVGGNIYRVRSGPDTRSSRLGPGSWDDLSICATEGR